MLCSVPDCYMDLELASRGGLAGCFFPFPLNKRLRKLWINKCKIPASVDISEAHVCWRHFRAKDFEREMVLKTDAVPSFKLAGNRVKGSSKNVPAVQSEKAPPIAVVLPIKKFICSLCGFKFSKEIFLTNHYKFCKDVDNPADRLGAEKVNVEEDSSYVVVQSKECPGNDSPFDLRFDIKDEEVEFTETTILPEVTPVWPLPEKPIENLTTDREDVLFRRNTRKKIRMTRLNTPVNRETEASGEIPKNQKFVCNLCGLRFSKEWYLEKHYNFCKDVMNSTNRLGVNRSIVKTALCEGEVQTMEIPEKNLKGEPMCDMNTDLDVESIKPSTTETPVKLSKLSTSQSRILGKHIKKHTAIKPFKCTICEYATSDSGILKIHMKKHTREELFKCTICEYSATESEDLKDHMRKHTGEKSFKCTICEYSTAQSGQLQIPMRKHTGENQFKCTICDYSIVWLQDPKLHMSSHTDEKPIKCTICEYSTAHSGQLTIHMRKHTGEKPFKCTICEYSAARSGHLIIHMSKHTGEKPFKCTICEYSAARSGQLIIHMRKHTGEKPFKCTICKYSAAQSGQLKIHMRKHTE